MNDNSFYTGKKPAKKMKGWLKRLLVWLGIGAVVGTGVIIMPYKPNEPQFQTPFPLDSVGVMYGINGNLSHSAMNYSNAMFVDSLLKLHPQIIRFPGGSVAENFHWQTDSNKIVDLANMVRVVGCPIDFVLNMTTETLESNMQMLHVAQSLGIPIRIVELDNEVNNINSDGRHKFLTAQAYADTCRVWVQALRNDFDSLTILIVGENKSYAPDVRNWMTTVDGIADYKVLHEYPNPNLFVTDGHVNYHLLDSVVLDDLRETGFDLETHFCVTEMNVKNSDKSGTTAYIEPAEWANAIVHVAALLKEHGAVIICLHNVVGKEGIWDVTKKSITLQPTGVALKEILNQ